MFILFSMIRPTIPGLSHLTINSIFCIGRNYVEHAKELNNPVPDNPVIFSKPVTSIIFSGDTIILPQYTDDVHHETEVVIAIGKPGKNIPRDEAMDYIAGYAIGIDVTARDIQSKLKEKSHPWEVAKGLDTFAPVSDFVIPDKVFDPADLRLALSVNGTLRQSGTTADMIFPIDDIISRLSEFFTLSPGDLIFTGTPEGVAKIEAGDELHAILGEQLTELKVDVANG